MATPVAAATLWFVGDGSETDIATATAGAPSTWPMSLEGHGGMATSFQQAGVRDVNSPGNEAIPTFVWADPVSIGGAAPVVVHIFVEDPWGGFCGGMDGQLFDGEGNVLGPAAGLLVATTGGFGVVEELVFSFEGIAGEFSGLQFQVGGHWTDCSSLPYTFHWGTDETPSRLEYAPMEVAMGGPLEVAGNLSGAVANVQHAFTNATSAAYHYNWTTNATEFVLEALANVTSGSANVTIVDAANATVANLTFPSTSDPSGNQSAAADTDGAGAIAGNRTLNVTGEPGNWTIRIVYDNFTGNLTLSLGARPEPEPEPEASPTTTSEAEATGGFPLHREEETPGLTLVPLLAVVALAATALRRRLP